MNGNKPNDCGNIFANDTTNEKHLRALLKKERWKNKSETPYALHLEEQINKMRKKVVNNQKVINKYIVCW